MVLLPDHLLLWKWKVRLCVLHCGIVCCLVCCRLYVEGHVGIACILGTAYKCNTLQKKKIVWWYTKNSACRENIENWSLYLKPSKQRIKLTKYFSSWMKMLNAGKYGVRGSYKSSECVNTRERNVKLMRQFLTSQCLTMKYLVVVCNRRS